jgi:hypothetical protein
MDSKGKTECWRTDGKEGTVGIDSFKTVENRHTIHNHPGLPTQIVELPNGERGYNLGTLPGLSVQDIKNASFGFERSSSVVSRKDQAIDTYTNKRTWPAFIERLKYPLDVFRIIKANQALRMERDALVFDMLENSATTPQDIDRIYRELTTAHHQRLAPKFGCEFTTRRLARATRPKLIRTTHLWPPNTP